MLSKLNQIHTQLKIGEVNPGKVEIKLYSFHRTPPPPPHSRTMQSFILFYQRKSHFKWKWVSLWQENRDRKTYNFAIRIIIFNKHTRTRPSAHGGNNRKHIILFFTLLLPHMMSLCSPCPLVSFRVLMASLYRQIHWDVEKDDKRSTGKDIQQHLS